MGSKTSVYVCSKTTVSCLSILGIVPLPRCMSLAGRCNSYADVIEMKRIYALFAESHFAESHFAESMGHFAEIFFRQSGHRNSAKWARQLSTSAKTDFQSYKVIQSIKIVLILEKYKKSIKLKSDIKYKTCLGYVPISSSAQRPLGAAYVPILLSEVKQEQRPSGNGHREAIVVVAGLCNGEASVLTSDMPHIIFSVSKSLFLQM